MRRSPKAARQRFAPALCEGAGVAALGFFGAELLFAAELAAFSLPATLVPALTAGALVTALRLDSPPTA